MRPYFFRFDIANGGSIQFKLDSKIPYSFLAISNINRLFFCYFRSSRSRSLKIWVSTALKHISNIIGLCAKIEMVWVYTNWIIAFMQNANSFRNLANMNLPRNSMCFTSSRIKINLPVTVTIKACSPKPTCSGFFNFFKEPFFYWSRFNSHNPYLVYRTEVV